MPGGTGGEADGDSEPPGGAGGTEDPCGETPETSQRFCADRDGDGVGDERFCTRACQAPEGYVSAVGDCDDLDPMTFPERSPVRFVTDRCGQGLVVEPMSASTGFSLFQSDAIDGQASLMAEQTGCLGGGLATDYRLPTPTPCGPTDDPTAAHCSWIVWRRTFAPLDISQAHYLVVPFHGDPGDPSLQLDVKLESAGCLRAFAIPEVTDLPVKRAMLVPLALFSSPGPNNECVVDLENVSAFEVGIVRRLGRDPSGSPTAGRLHLDAVTAVRRDEVALPATHYSCPPRDEALSHRIARNLLERHTDSLAERGHSFVPSWYEETPPNYYIYNEALVLIVLSLEFDATGDNRYLVAATRVADELVALQQALGDGRWYDAYRDGSSGELVNAAGETSWVGNVAWVVIGLDLFREIARTNAALDTTAYDRAIERAGEWLEGQQAVYGASGGPVGAITEGTEGNVSAAFGLLAAGRFEAAQRIAGFLMARPWDANEQRFWMGYRYPGLALDVMGGWGVDFLRAIGEHEAGLASLGLSAGLFAVPSFDDRHFGLGDIAGPWQPAWEFVSQYLAAGGPGGTSLLEELRAYESNGAIMGSPHDFAGGDGWNTSWHGVAPSAMAYIALAGGVLRGSLLPFFADDFELGMAWESTDEIVEPGCYGTGLGEATVVDGIASRGTRALSVWANRSRSNLSHHLIAGQRVAQEGVSGKWKLELDAYVDPATATQGEVGPEFSVQSTRRLGSAFLTTTAGVQYRANDLSPDSNGWAIWLEEEPGRAAWRVLHHAPLTPGHWYHFTLNFDLDARRYLELEVRGPDAQFVLDLSKFRIAEERKFQEEALWVTVEAENRWGNCGETEPTSYLVAYDGVRLVPQP